MGADERVLHATGREKTSSDRSGGVGNGIARERDCQGDEDGKMERKGGSIGARPRPRWRERSTIMWECPLASACIARGLRGRASNAGAGWPSWDVCIRPPARWTSVKMRRRGGACAHLR